MRIISLSGHLAANTLQGEAVLIVAIDVQAEDDIALCIEGDGKMMWRPLKELTTGWRYDPEIMVWTNAVSTIEELEEWEQTEQEATEHE